MAPQSPIKLSIVVPCYKTENLLPRCLDSLLAQDLDGIEIIAVNDGSPDGTLALLRFYEKAHPDLVRVVDKKNGGLWNARWSGTEVALGDYVAYLDSDDYVAPTFASDLYETAIREDADIVVCGFNRIDEESGDCISTEMDTAKPTFLPHEEPGRLVEINPAAWNKCYRRDLLMRMHRLDAPPLILEDVTLTQLAYLACDGKLAFTGTAPHYYMVRKGSMINTVTPAQVESVKKAMLEVKSDFVADGASQALQEELDAVAFLHLGVSMSFRLSSVEGLNLGLAIAQTTAYLDESFPTWRNNTYIKFGYAAVHKGAYAKLFLSHAVYKAHLMRPFLAAYRFFLAHTGKDIKW